jgi:hypothetical protein
MVWRKILRFVFPLACIACLAAGYAAAGQGWALWGVWLALLAWLPAFQWRSGFFPLSALILSIGLAAAGLFVSAPFPLMILAATFALAGWDAVLFYNTLIPDPPAGSAGLLEKRHYRSLIWVFGVGLLIAASGPAIRIRISFGWVILLAILTLLSLEGLWRKLRG